MTAPEAMIELWRGGMCESVHHGHAVIFGPEGIEAAWGDPETVIFPRSSVKMIQALPLVESGAAEAAGLTTCQLALSCASHSGARMHRAAVEDWLATLGMKDDDLRCGAHLPRDKAEKKHLICADDAPCQAHNNCSGKHAGFLTLNRHLGGGPDYIDIDHPVQRAVKSAFEEVTEESSPRYGIDGCSAPNFATSLAGLARAMQFFASAKPDGDLRARAAARLVDAMMEYPEMVAGEGRACTEIMREANGRVAVKTGAEGVYVAMLPDQKRGVALKITDGATRASEAAIIALLIRLGALDANAPVVHRRLTGPITNWRGLKTGELRRAAQFP